MALINKQSKQAEVVTFKRIELTDDKQTKSLKFLDKVQMLRDKQLDMRNGNTAALKRMQEIDAELNQLNSDQVLELDVDKLKEISRRKSDLSIEKGNLFIMDEPKIRQIIRSGVKSDEVYALSSASNIEYAAFRTEIDQTIAELKDEVKRLEKLKNDHLNQRASTVRNGLLMG